MSLFAVRSRPRRSHQRTLKLDITKLISRPVFAEIPVVSNHRDRHLRSRGFTLVELLVVIAVIGLLVSLLFPAVNSAREAARRMQCASNLRQVALAVTNFESAFAVYPPARYATRPFDIPTYCAGQQPSWMVRIMPYLEETAQYERWDLQRDFYEHPDEVRAGVVPAYLCPTRRGPTTAETRTYELPPAPCGCGGFRYQFGGALGDFAAVHGDPSPEADGGEMNFTWGGYGTGIIISARPKCSDDFRPRGWIDRIGVRDVKDGLSNTLLVGEAHVQLKALGEFPYDGPIYDGGAFESLARVGGPGFPIATGANDTTTGFVSFGSWHPGICHFAAADVSIRTLTPTIDTLVLASLCHRNDGQPVDSIGRGRP